MTQFSLIWVVWVKKVAPVAPTLAGAKSTAGVEMHDECTSPNGDTEISVSGILEILKRLDLGYFE
jgi:hypothetical protein